MSFLVDSVDVEKKKLTPQSRLVIALDNSASTGDHYILHNQVAFAKKIQNFFVEAAATCIEWNTTAVVVKNFDSTFAYGGTNPSSFLVLMQQKNIKTDLLVLITDGQIENVEQFRQKIKETHLDCPIVVVLSVTECRGRETMQTYASVDMSMVEACLTASSNVAVLVEAGAVENTVWLFGTGYFAQFVKSDELSKPIAQRQLANMNRVDFNAMWQIKSPPATTTTVNAVSTVPTTERNIFSSIYNALWSMLLSGPSDSVPEEQAEQPPIVEEIFPQFEIVFQQLPENVVQIDDGRFLLLDRLYEYCGTFEENIGDVNQQKQLAAALMHAANRTVLPKLNLDKMRFALDYLCRHVKQWSEKQAFDAIYQHMFALQMQIHLEDTDDKKDSIRKQIECMRTQLQALRAKQRIVVPELQNAMLALSAVLVQYLHNKAAFDYSSHRAANARAIDETELEQVGNCMRGECPVMLADDQLCVFFQAPKIAFGGTLNKNNDDNDDEDDLQQLPTAGKALSDRQRAVVTKYFTRNQMIDNSALCGAAMMQCLTPGIFGIDFATNTAIEFNPLTKAPLLGYMPLSYDMRVLIRFLSTLMCGGQEMPFILPAYVSMVAQNAAATKWVQPQLLTHAKYVLNNLLVRCRFIDDSKLFNATMSDSVQYQLQHPACLRLLSHGQVMALIDIATQLMPDFKFNAAQARGVANFCDVVRNVRKLYVELAQQKRPCDILLECFRSDGTLRNTLYGHVAWFFADTHRLHGHELRLLRFQQCVDRMLADSKYGTYFASIVAGATPPVDLPQLVPEIVEPSVDNIHFDVKKSLAMYKRLLSQPANAAAQQRTTSCCAYCDAEFSGNEEMMHDTQLACHVKNVQGPHFIEFTRILLHKRDLFVGTDASATEQNIMRYLQRRCGSWFMAIYTQRTRKEIRAMIEAVCSLNQ